MGGGGGGGGVFFFLPVLSLEAKYQISGGRPSFRDVLAKTSKES